MRISEDGDTVQVLLKTGLPLGVVCQACSHRMLVRHTRLISHEDDRTQLRRLPLICRCGRRQIELFVMETPDDGQAFLSGDRPGVASKPGPSFF